ncbi:hypothetical protein BJ742DRAFT_388573 [Cladochytrium replicatum]|nr:hypothetical protein BJ742DRAFT_388573 [Cladochytrium replicatum]
MLILEVLSGSNHGTYINKTAVPGRTYCHLRPGDIVKFGASTRLYVFSRHGPPPKTSSSSTAAPAALKEEVTWGFGDDAADEDEAEIAAGMNIGLPVNQRKRRRNNNHEEFEDPEDIVKSMARFSGGTATIVEDTNDDTRLIAQDAPYLSDPKKAMKGWLDARGIPMFDLDFENLGAKDGFEAVLDISTPSGRLKSKARGWSKREAEKACYLQACAKLDAAGLFYVSASEARDKERKRWKELVGDDEDDERDSYLDRTGKYDKGSTSDGPKGAAGAKKKTENLASLQAKRQTLVKEVEAMKARITSQESSADKLTHGPGEDDLEGYMAQLAKQEKQKES